MKTVASFGKPEEAHLARSMLEGSGISAVVRDEFTVGLNWLYSSAVGGVKVDVADEDLQRAREVLELPPVAASLWRCPYCGSDRVKPRQLSILAALSLLLGIFLPFTTRKLDCPACGRTFELDPRGRRELPPE